MRVILLKKVENLGEMGDIKDVKSGYARNFLFPRGLAKPATTYNVENIERIKEKNYQREEKKLKELIMKLKEEKFVIKRKAGKEGRIFGRVTTKDILSLLKDKGFKDLPYKCIKLKHTIKSVGNYSFYIVSPKIGEEELSFSVEREE